MLASSASSFDSRLMCFDASRSLRAIPNWLLQLYRHAGTDRYRIPDHRLSWEPLLRSRSTRLRTWILGLGGPHFGPPLLSPNVKPVLGDSDQGAANTPIPAVSSALANRPWWILIPRRDVQLSFNSLDSWLADSKLLGKF